MRTERTARVTNTNPCMDMHHMIIGVASAPKTPGNHAHSSLPLPIAKCGCADGTNVPLRVRGEDCTCTGEPLEGLSGLVQYDRSLNAEVDTLGQKCLRERFVGVEHVKLLEDGADVFAEV